jgi:hypothetical protein
MGVYVHAVIVGIELPPTLNFRGRYEHCRKSFLSRLQMIFSHPADFVVGTGLEAGNSLFVISRATGLQIEHGARHRMLATGHACSCLPLPSPGGSVGRDGSELKKCYCRFSLPTP